MKKIPLFREHVRSDNDMYWKYRVLILTLNSSFSKTNKPFEMSLVPSESYDIELYDIED